MRNIIKGMIAVALAATVAACGTTPAQQSAMTAAATTLAGVAASKNATVASLVTKGALFCQEETSAGPLVVALANLAGAPVSVTNQASADVAAACAAINSVPVPAPTAAASVTVVQTSTTLPAAQ